MRRILPLLSLALLACPGGNNDKTPPEVTEVSPRAFQQDVALNAAISITFNEPIKAESVNAQTFQVNGDVAGTYAVDGNTATLTPVKALPRNTSLTVTVSGVQDAAGNTLADPYSWTFTTGTSPDTTAPKAITSLKVKAAGKDTVELTWFASGDDGTLGNATAYDLRYLTGSACPITAESFAGATPVAGMPQPKPFNSFEDFTVTGLQGTTIYCFALKTLDEVPNASELSNVVTTTTLDNTPPAAIVLAQGTLGSTSVSLNWTAVGDDGSIGTAKSYDLRYLSGAACPLTDANFSTGTQVTVTAPAAAGTAETTTVSSLTPNTDYCFAIKAADEVQNLSPLSNVLSIHTLEVTPPAAVSDLAATLVGATSLEVSFTAPGDDGTTGTATSYDLRYLEGAACPITAGNFTTGTRVTTTAPQAAGATEHFQIDNLKNGASYCFAVLTSDEVPNVSAFSNVAVGSIPDVIAPSQVTDLGVANATSTEVTLSFTSVGDDGTTGTATSYEFRMALGTGCFLGDAEFATATIVPNTLTPKPAGQAETAVLGGFSQGTHYCLAMVAIDDAGNRSSVSTMTEVDTPVADAVPPAAIADLSVASTTKASATLTWTATGNDGSTGTALSYELRQLSGAACSGTPDFSTAAVVSGVPNPQASGAAETFTVTGLNPNTAYCFQLFAKDATSTVGSNVASGTTRRDPSLDIQAVRDAIASQTVAGPVTLNLTVGDVVVSYTKPGFAGFAVGHQDGPGFFLQADATGPAIFVALDPATFAGGVQPGDVLDLHVTQGNWISCSSCTTTPMKGLLAITAATATKTGTAAVPAPQDVSSLAVTTALSSTAQWSLEAERISLSGKVVGAFAGAGGGFTSAQITTAGTTAGTNNYRLRIPDAVMAATGVVNGCNFSLTGTPAWRFNTEFNPSAWAASELSVSNCPTVTVVRTAPADAATGVPLTSTVGVVLSAPVDASSITAQTTAGSCSGTFQVSSDNFATCIAFTSAAPVVSPEGVMTNAAVSFQPAVALSGSTLYRVKLLAGVKSTNGTALASDFVATTGFTTASGPPAVVLVNEVAPTEASGKDLIELYVVSAGTLSGLEVVEGNGATVVLKAFPDKLVGAGEYIVIHLNSTGTDETTSQTQSSDAGAIATAWDFWSSDTGLAATDNVIAIRAGSTYLDALLYGNNSNTWTGDTSLSLVTPILAAGQWTKAGTTFVEADTVQKASGAIVAGESAKRTPNGVNGSNSKADWVITTGLTFGAANP